MSQTRRSTLFQSCLVGQVDIQHNLKEVTLVSKVVSNFNPFLVIELGTALGGLTALFFEFCPKASIYTFDIRRQVPKGKRLHGVTYCISDVMKCPELSGLCKDKRKKLLYCDNGNKASEFRLYAPLLNPGDLVGVHDWDEEIFECDIVDLLDRFEPLTEDYSGASSRFWLKK